MGSGKGQSKRINSQATTPSELKFVPNVPITHPLSVSGALVYPWNPKEEVWNEYCTNNKIASKNMVTHYCGKEIKQADITNKDAEQVLTSFLRDLLKSKSITIPGKTLTSLVNPDDCEVRITNLPDINTKSDNKKSYSYELYHIPTNTRLSSAAAFGVSAPITTSTKVAMITGMKQYYKAGNNPQAIARVIGANIGGGSYWNPDYIK